MHPLIKNFLLWSFQERTRRVVAMLKPHISGPTLDVGCGNGDVTVNLKHDDIVGIDVYEPSNPRIDVQVYDGEHIPFPDQTFETVICVTALHHAPDAGAMLEEMSRVGRKLVIVEDRFDNILHRKSVLWLHEISFRLLGIDYDPKLFKTLPDWKTLFEQNQLNLSSCILHRGSQAFWPFLQHYVFVLEPTKSAIRC